MLEDYALNENLKALFNYSKQGVEEVARQSLEGISLYIDSESSREGLRPLFDARREKILDFIVKQTAYTLQGITLSVKQTPIFRGTCLPGVGFTFDLDFDGYLLSYKFECFHRLILLFDTDLQPLFVEKDYNRAPSLSSRSSFSDILKKV